MSIVKKNKKNLREACIAKNSTLETLRQEMENARRLYQNTKAKVLASEYRAMKEMLDVVRNSDHPLTAKEIASRCNSGISKYEVAGNLFAMQNHHTRYYYNPAVTVPRTTYDGKGEYIVSKGGGTHYAKIVEIDEKGDIIPNTEQTISLYEHKRYSIEKI